VRVGTLDPVPVRVGLVTLGCDKNTVDSERYLGELLACGAEHTTELATADVIVVNTCGFIDAAKRESIDALVQAGRLKDDGACRTLVAVGCMVERHRVELEEALPEVDVFLGSSETHRLVAVLSQRGLIDTPEELRHPGVRAFVGDLPHVRYLKVSEGCDHGCAFCAIPLMRGRHRSFAGDDIVREAQLLEMQGARELNLVAQDLAHYGRDRRDGRGLPELLRTLLAETTVPWLRLLYLYSSGITPRLLDVLANEPRVAKYLDMPVQHGSDAVLERMRRPERAATIGAAVARAREAVPGVAIRTTCIVGFPGETEDDVARLVDLLEEVRFERVGVFTYSPQSGTRAAELPDDVPEALKYERAERVAEVSRAVTAELYESRVGAVARAIVDRPAEWPGAGVLARLAWQADDIDGISRLDRDDLAPGCIVEAVVEDVVDDYDFRASVRRVVHPANSVAPVRGRRALPVAAPGLGTVGSYGR
jgi:ribosomal protein S12 methylthiotransferase